MPNGDCVRQTTSERPEQDHEITERASLVHCSCGLVLAGVSDGEAFAEWERHAESAS